MRFWTSKSLRSGWLTIEAMLLLIDVTPQRSHRAVSAVQARSSERNEDVRRSHSNENCEY
jgi:hypothetical protein